MVLHNKMPNHKMIKIINPKVKNLRDNNCFKKLLSYNKNVKTCKLLRKLLKDILDFKFKH